MREMAAPRGEGGDRMFALRTLVLNMNRVGITWIWHAPPVNARYVTVASRGNSRARPLAVSPHPPVTAKVVAR